MLPINRDVRPWCLLHEQLYRHPQGAGPVVGANLYVWLNVISADGSVLATMRPVPETYRSKSQTAVPPIPTRQQHAFAGVRIDHPLLPQIVGRKPRQWFHCETD